MKKIFLLLSPILLFGYSIDFETALNKTIELNKSLQAKKLSVEYAKSDLDMAKGYSYGSLVFDENISKTNNAGYVFGMKLSSREADFGAFGFNEFISQMDTITPGSSTNDGGTKILSTQPEDLNHPESRTNYETKLTYKVPLFTGFKLQNAKKMAKLQILAKTAQYNYDEKELGLEVLKAYNGAVAAKEFIKATQKAKKATASFVEFAHALYEEGLVTSIDVKQAQVYDMDVDAVSIEAVNRYELAISYLRFLTTDENITDVGMFHKIENEITNIQQLQKKAQENRDDISSMRYNTETMKANVDLHKADFFPTVGAQIEYGYNDDQFNNIDSEHDYYLGAIGFSYNLFDGFITTSKTQKAKIEYKKTQYYYDYMKDGINLEVEKNILTLNAKKKILDQKIKANTLSSEVLEQSQAMYKNHLINMSNLLMQQANQQKANAQMILAKYEASMAAGKLKVSLGESLK